MRITIVASGFVVLVLGAALYRFAPPATIAALVPQLTMRLAPPAPPLPAPVPVVIATARVEAVPIGLAVIGTVQAYNTVNLKTRVDGQITEIRFREGQDVKVGDTLAIIDPHPLEAQLQQQIAARARDHAQLDGAVLDLTRFRNLVARDYATRQQVDQQVALVGQYEAQVQSDEAQIAYAKTQLGYTTVAAPIDGRIGIRQIDVGNVVHAADNSTITVITQLQPISAVFNVAASVLSRAKLTLGTANVPVIAFAQDGTTELDRGTVDLIDNQVDPATGTIKVKASFPNSALKLWPGNFVTGRIIVDTRRSGVTVPSAAVRHGPSQDFVWLVSAGKAVFRPVISGQSYGGRTLVERGLAGDELVVVEGNYRLENGTRVEIRRNDPDSRSVPTRSNRAQP